MHRDLVVIGGSAGAIEALKQILAALPKSLQASVVVVLHTSPRADGMLPRILDRVGPLPAANGITGEPLQYGRIYVAPPDHHLIVDDSRMLIHRGPRENRHRPAIDPTFRSAAMSYRRRAIGVILTGALDDGTSGLMVIRARGGVAIVQDPATALFPSMPRSALLRVPDAIVSPVEGIAGLIQKYVGEAVEGEVSAKTFAHHPGNPKRGGNPGNEEDGAPDERMRELDAETEPESPSQFACPECGGVLWEIDQQGLLRYRCRVGHAYTANYLQTEQNYAVESAFWAALRALEESASLYERMAQRARDEMGHSVVQETFAKRASDARSNAKTLRDFLLSYGEKLADPETAE